MERNTTRDELEAKMDRGDAFGLMDAPSPRDYEGAHPPGTVDLPLEPDCATAGMGYGNLRRYPGGKQGWIDAGLPVEGTHAELV